MVDDGSLDGTAALAGAVAAEDSRFAVRVDAARRAWSRRSPRGSRAAAAEYVARMDADDLMRRDRLAAQVAALDAAPELAAVGAHVRFFPRTGMSDGLRAYERWLYSIDSPARVRAEAFVECPVAHPTLLARRIGAGGASAIAIGAGPRTTISSCACSPPGTRSAWCRAGCSPGATARHA